MQVLIVVGNDKLGRKFIHEIDHDNFEIVLDKSSSLKRIISLIKKRSLSFSLILKMFLAEFFRTDYKLTKTYESIQNNDQLINKIKEKNIEKIVLFRGGLIVNKKVLDLNIETLNIHCARLPEYGGIGVIDKALKNKAYHQEATLHKITEKIDSGEVIAIEPYLLYKKNSYLLNENIAYAAGIQLFKRYFQ